MSGLTSVGGDQRAGRRHIQLQLGFFPGRRLQHDDRIVGVEAGAHRQPGHIGPRNIHGTVQRIETLV